ncbi:MAG: hypothetical protein L6Q95_17775 [Planctomycetes bacterium]|nr:hypothetical protein [Planctomycetota bacterium]
MRRLFLPAALAAAYLAGLTLARGEGDESAIKELLSHEELLLQDLKKIEQAVKDVLEIRKMRESGQFVLNDEEKKLERQGREDFHVFMERFRNDALEVLAILDAAVEGKSAVDPLRRVYGKALEQLVTVAWNEEELDLLLGEISQTYGVPIHTSGEMDRRRTMSLNGEMSLLSVLLQIENVFDGKFVVRDGHLWLVLVPPEEGDAGGERGTGK